MTQNYLNRDPTLVTHNPLLVQLVILIFSALLRSPHIADARQVYIDLKAYSLESTKASLESAKLLEYIVGTSIDDGTWKGTAEGFILHWLEQIRKYENAMHDNVKRLHL